MTRNAWRTSAGPLGGPCRLEAGPARPMWQLRRDALTGLPNHSSLAEQAQSMQARARRDGRETALLLLDIDRIKHINASLGHGAGDVLLRVLAGRLRALCGAGAIVARLGGDEFAVLFQVADATQASVTARQLLDLLATAVTIDGQILYPVCSAGLVLTPRDGVPLHRLLRQAAAARCQAKCAGSGLAWGDVCGTADGARRRLQLEAALRQAIERDELQIHYQPKVCARSARLLGAEALLRWRHVRLGAISPAEFIPLAEETGLIRVLGMWVLRAVCRQLALWRAQGLTPPVISVNVSARQLSADGLVEQIEQVMRDSGLCPASVQLELTESSLMQPSRVGALLGRLRALGLTLALDDFGTGFSSLSYLHCIPVDQIKIDQSFVRQLLHDARCATITIAIIRLAHALDMQVVAEGVETEAQRQFLALHDCDQLQGYLTGRPQPAADLAVLLVRDGARRAWRHGWLSAFVDSCRDCALVCVFRKRWSLLERTRSLRKLKLQK